MNLGVTLARTGVVAASFAVAAEELIVVASKNFTEAYILGEAVAQLLESEGFEIDRKIGLGGTKICYDALVEGDVDVYVEYTGTIAEAIKNIDGEPTRQKIAEALAPDGVEMLDDFGFNNTYALAVPRQVAEERGLGKISDLPDHPDLRMAVSHEFLERPDGWPGLQRLYGIEEIPDGIEHALAYEALADGSIHLTDAYSTDGELKRYDLTVLEDDRGFFPTYMAVPLVRTDLDPRARNVLRRVGGTLDDVEMSDLNAAAVFGGRSTEAIAASYLLDKGIIGTNAGAEVVLPRDSLVARLSRNTGRHLFLVAGAVLPATLVAVGLALAIFKLPWFSRGAVYIAGLMQTIPSIALLALLIPLVGIGWLPAVIALFLYALLPILRNAVTALTSIEPTLRRVAVAMGLKPAEELRHVFVPLAMPSIVAGVRTAAVICIGTATLAAFIGAGGLGDPIVKGLALNDTRLILEGAIPAASLAVLTELVFEAVERWLVPGHLRSSNTAGTAI
ncbi:MAG: ABC transporter permease subunit [Gammaproteobacteria bacterium]|nr:ABC transporter permease subunit [Gammaproteobacteria bacterium]